MKSATRLVSVHAAGSAEYKKEFDKLLPDGKTCGDCVYRNYCQSLFPEQNTYCQFYPNKFKEGKPLKQIKRKAKKSVKNK